VQMESSRATDPCDIGNVSTPFPTCVNQDQIILSQLPARALSVRSSCVFCLSASGRGIVTSVELTTKKDKSVPTD
jgi:hypothetical protein